MTTKNNKHVCALKKQFEEVIAPALQKELKLSNKLAVPRLSKVMINVGIGKMLDGGKDYSHVLQNITAIAGQKPLVAKARKSISNFKLREGMPVGIYVTLRGEKAYEFIYKLVNVTLPRTRDFRGISPKSFDGKGNYSMAIKEHTVFPEINADDLVKLHSLQITVCTTAKDNASGFALLKALGFPFQDKK